MKTRRVTTGHDAHGMAIFVSDAEVEGDMFAPLPGLSFTHLWGADAPPSFPDSGAKPAYKDYFPPLGGFRFMIFTVPPMPAEPLSPEARQTLLSEYREKAPGLAEHMEPTNPGMHTTSTVDFEYIISGEVWLELDNGAIAHLRAGDTVVQNGTRHAWRNKGATPCQIAVFMLGVPRSPSGLEVARRAV